MNKGEKKPMRYDGNITIYHLLEGAKQAKGFTVIIDVFRAFSLECYLYSMGAKSVRPVGSLEEAYSLKRQHPEYLLAGERKENAKVSIMGILPVLLMKTMLRGK